MTDLPTQRFYKLSELQEILRLSRDHLKRLCRSGRLPAIKLSDGGGSPWLVSQADLDMFLEKRKRRPR